MSSKRVIVDLTEEDDSSNMDFIKRFVTIRNVPHDREVLLYDYSSPPPHLPQILSVRKFLDNFEDGFLGIGFRKPHKGEIRLVAEYYDGYFGYELRDSVSEDFEEVVIDRFHNVYGRMPY